MLPRIGRTLPPTAAPVAFRDLLQGLKGMIWEEKIFERLEIAFQDFFGVKHLFFLSSGKAALKLGLAALQSISGRQKVIIPAYTCFSVPASVASAGLKVALCDLELERLDFNPDLLNQMLDDETLCVIHTHLFGIPSNLNLFREKCKMKGIFILEDACQAMGSNFQGMKTGTLGDLSFFSFGRGKNITSGSGGILLTSSDQIADAIAREYAVISKEPPIKRFLNWMEVVGIYALIRPSIYWLPAALPFLRLGETQYDPEFPVYRMDGGRGGLLKSWKKRMEHLNGLRQAAALDYRECLKEEVLIPVMKPKETIPFLRFPVLLENRNDKELLIGLSRKYGYGISPMYPKAIQDIPDVPFFPGQRHCPEARKIADTLVTLPTHPYLTRQDRVKISGVVNEVVLKVAANNANRLSLSFERQKT